MGFYEEAPAGNYETQTNSHKYPVRDSEYNYHDCLPALPNAIAGHNLAFYYVL